MIAPDFFDAASPASSDLDLLVERILQEIGGIWLPAGSGTPTRYDGAVGATQMPAAPAAGSFLNAQKTEAASLTCLTLDAAMSECVLPVGLHLLAMSMQQDSANIVDHGQIDLSIDGKLWTSLYPGPAAAARTAYSWALSRFLAAGQRIGFVHSLVNAAGTPIDAIRCTFWCRALHVPFDTKVRL